MAWHGVAWLLELFKWLFVWSFQIFPFFFASLFNGFRTRTGVLITHFRSINNFSFCFPLISIEFESSRIELKWLDIRGIHIAWLRFSKWVLNKNFFTYNNNKIFIDKCLMIVKFSDGINLNDSFVSIAIKNSMENTNLSDFLSSFALDLMDFILDFDTADFWNLPHHSYDTRGERESEKLLKFRMKEELKKKRKIRILSSCPLFLLFYICLLLLLLSIQNNLKTVFSQLLVKLTN